MNLAQLLYLMISLTLHLGILLPLLAGLLAEPPTPVAPLPPARLQMRPRSKPPTLARASKTATSRKSTQTSPASATPRAAAAPGAPFGRSHAHTTTSPRPGSLGGDDVPSYTKAGRAGRARATHPEPTPEVASNPAPAPPPEPEPEAVALVPAQAMGLPHTVKVPFWLKKRDLPNFRARIRCQVDIHGRALASIEESCGQRDMDRFLIDQIQSLRWQPAHRGGVACETTLVLTVHGDFSTSQEEFTLREEPAPESRRTT